VKLLKGWPGGRRRGRRFAKLADYKRAVIVIMPKLGKNRARVHPRAGFLGFTAGGVRRRFRFKRGKR
jgi:hypothetical protein